MELASYFSANITVLAAAGIATNTTQTLSSSLSNPVNDKAKMVIKELQ